VGADREYGIFARFVLAKLRANPRQQKTSFRSKPGNSAVITNSLSVSVISVFGMKLPLPGTASVLRPRANSSNS
jgi:hypothetical protein